MKKQAKFFIVFVFLFLMLLSSCGTILESNSNPKTDNKETKDDSNKKEDEKKDNEDKDNPSFNENIDDPDEPIDDPDNPNDDNEDPVEPDDPTPIAEPIEPEDSVEEVTFVVTFMDGELTLKIEHIKENDKIKLFTPTKVNYHFLGWYKNELLTEPFDINELISESKTLYAKWEEVIEQEALTHEITFMDGDIELRSLTIESGNKIVDYKPNKANHTFLGWYKDSALTEAFDLKTIITESQVLFAKWKANTFTVIFMDGNTELKREIVNFGKTITPYEPEKTHYGFDSWHLDKDLTELFDENEKITSNITLYAKWIKDSYKVTFIDDGEVLKNIIIEYGDKIQAYTPEKKHYSFAGWYFDSSFNDAFSYNDLIDSDSLLYAKWEKTIYDVIYLDGDSEIKTEQIESGKKAKEFEPEKDNFSFIGWYKDEALTTSFDFDDEILSNTTLYSKWYDLVNFETIGSTTKVGMNYKINGYVERTLPIISNEGSVSVYPEWFTAYPSSYNDSDYISLALENVSLISSDTNYNYMDKDGNLYLRNSSGELTTTGKNLYKHTASLTMYTNPDLADRTKAYIPDDEPAVSKTINIYDPKLVGNYVTGLYAQPGEVIEINISEEDLKRIGGLTVWIGNRRSHEFYNASTTDANNIGFMTNGKRMPIIHQMFSVKETKAYVGSFLGGPIYIEPTNKVAFSVTIEGALEYLHYIDGLTTKEEFERLEKTSAPYFDLEIYDTGARFSGPRYTVNPIEEIENGVSSLSYDNYVKTSKLWSAINEYSMLVPHARNDYINIEMCFETNVVGGLAMAYIGAHYCRLPIGWMPSTLSYDSFMRSGGWGVIHEYNHHHQKYGANGSSNEVTNNIVNYMEYVLLTNITAFRNYGTSGHEIGLSSHYDIEYLNQYFGTTTTLNEEKGYALLVQNFGPLNFLAVTVAQKNDNLNVAQVERNTNWYKRLCNTLEMDFTYLIRDLWHLELDSSAVSEIEAKDYPVYLPVGSFYATNFQFTNKSGVLNSNNALPYYCNSTITLDLANDINVVNGCKVEILDVGAPTYGTLKYDSISNTYLYENKTDKVDSFDVEVKVTKDNIEEIVIITMSFKPINSCISVETYKMENDTYNTIREALADDFSKATSKTISQSSSQKITGIKNGTITKVRGSFISTYEGTYDLCYCGGRGSSVMFAGINTQELEEIGYILINQSGYQFDSNAHSNKEVTLHKGDIVYYEIYLLSTSDNAWLQIGLSPDKIAKNVITLDDSLFGSFDGKYIKDVPLEIPNDNYKKSYKLNVDVTLDYSNYEATSEKFEPWDSTTTLLNIFDDNPNNYTHTKRYMYVSETNPIDVVVDCKKEETFNAISVEAYNSAQNYTPRKFDIYFSDDGIEFTLVKSVDTPSGSDRVNLVKFDEYQTTRYIKFIFKNSNGATNYFALSGIKLKCIEEFNIDQWNPDIATYFGNVLRNDIGLYGHGYTLNVESKVDFNAITNKVIFKTKIDSNDFKVLVNNNIITNYEVYDFSDGYSYIIIDNLNENDLVSIINLDGELKIFSISS